MKAIEDVFIDVDVPRVPEDTAVDQWRDIGAVSLDPEWS